MVGFVMKGLTLTSSLIAALSLTAFGQTDATLRSQISTKEKQLAEIQKELHELRSKLNAPVATSGYTVKTGDTIHSIARRHQVSPADLMKWNKITDPTKLGIGDQIVISGSSVKAPANTKVSTKKSSYVVTQGDTFYSIARRHKMTLAQLRSLNPDVSAHLIAPGQSINISGTAPKPSQTASKKTVVVVKETKKPVSPPAQPKTEKKESSKPNAAIASKKPVEKAAAKTTKKPTESIPQPPVLDEPAPAKETKAIILTDVVTFEAFASKHGTSTDQLNALNGWSLPKSTVLAGGSEILVPH